MKRLALLACILLAVGTTAQTVRPAYLPDRKLTPGTADASLTRDVICKAGWSAQSVRHTTNWLKKTVYRAYRVTSHKPGDYEIDHLVPLSCGGMDVRSNLWPEPALTVVRGRDMGYHQKDRLENALHKAICDGKITLARAQAGMKADWTVLYRRFVQDDFPEVDP